MEKKILGIVFVFLFGMFTFVSAVSSTTWVTFTVNPNNGSDVEAFNGQVDNLKIADRGNDWLYLTWDNPEDERFSYNMIFLDRLLIEETSDDSFKITGLEEDVLYTIAIIPVSDEGEEGIRSVISGRVLDKDRRESDKKTGMRHDPIPNFFVSEEKEPVGNVVISLGGAPVETKKIDWFVLIWFVLGSFILVLLILILILLAR